LKSEPAATGMPASRKLWKAMQRVSNTKVAPVYKKTGHLRACQLLLGPP
jgi:hypothetical protein